MVVMQISAHFTVYAVLQNRGKCFQIRSLRNIHTCKGLDDNPKVTKAWIARKCRNKVLVDPRLGIDMLTDYMKKMYRVIVAPQKVYKAKRRILKSIVGGDHFDNFKSI